MVRKGVSREDKLKFTMDFFFDTRGVFPKKDLERRLPKEKGIIRQSVMEVVQELVGDGLVETDKVGTGVYFWAFPSKATQFRKRKLATLSEDIGKVEESIAALTAEKDALLEQRQPGDDRAAKLRRLDEVQARDAELTEALQEYKDKDPDVIKDLQERTVVCKQAANRWTDNVFAMWENVKKKRPELKSEQFFQHFGLPKDFDYPE